MSRHARLYVSLVMLLAALAATPVAAQELEGPSEGKGRMNRVAGELPLADEFDAVHNRQLRMRYWEIEPSGVVPVHSHTNRPGIIWIEVGEITEYRSAVACQGR